MDILNEQEADFARPPPTSDKLYMAIGEKDVIEVAHPTPSHNLPRRIMESRVHLGPVASGIKHLLYVRIIIERLYLIYLLFKSGRQVARDDHLRQELAARLGILAFDSEFDSVLESVIGNRRDAFVVIRGIADYKVLTSLWLNVLLSNIQTLNIIDLFFFQDGTRRRDWQPHSALLAAAFGKAIVSRMDPPIDD
jgi:hypothetical protein